MCARVILITTGSVTIASGGTFQQLFKLPRYVKSITLQNATTQTTSVVQAFVGTGGNEDIPSGAVLIANPAGSVGEGGGTIQFPAHNYSYENEQGSKSEVVFDASTIWVTSTNTSDVIGWEIETWGPEI